MPATISCDPSTIAAQSACYCFDEPTSRAAIIFLLASIAGNTMTPAQLAAAASCYNCVPSDMQEAEITYLLCAAASAAGA